MNAVRSDFKSERTALICFFSFFYNSSVEDIFHFIFIYIYMCVCVCVCACARVCVCVCVCIMFVKPLMASKGTIIIVMIYARHI